MAACRAHDLPASAEHYSARRGLLTWFDIGLRIPCLAGCSWPVSLRRPALRTAAAWGVSMVSAGFIETHGLWTDDQGRLADELKRRLEADRVKLVRVAWADPHGYARAKLVTVPA